MAFELKLVLEELFVNIAHYGFPSGRARRPVSLQARVDEAHKRIYVTLIDAGIAYNPLSHFPEKISPDKGHRVGGLGLLLVRELVDDMYYERVNDLNIVHIVKDFV